MSDVVVVVVIAQQLFSYRQLSRLRKSATAAGCVAVWTCLSVYMYVCLSVSLCICLSLYLSVCLYVVEVDESDLDVVGASELRPARGKRPIFDCLPVCLSVCLDVSVCLYVCVCM